MEKPFTVCSLDRRICVVSAVRKPFDAASRTANELCRPARLTSRERPSGQPLAPAHARPRSPCAPTCPPPHAHPRILRPHMPLAPCAPQPSRARIPAHPRPAPRKRPSGQPLAPARACLPYILRPPRALRTPRAFRAHSEQSCGIRRAPTHPQRAPRTRQTRPRRQSNHGGISI